ncbi:hypothetical protein RQP46_005178 [Phenoliferia psychrophenolica]
MSKAPTAVADILQGRQDEVLHLENNGSDLPWYRNRGMLRLNLAISAIFVGQCLGGYDSSLVSGFQALTPWKEAMGRPSASAIGLLNAAVYISGLVTALFARYVADHYGRRFCILYVASCNLLGTVLGLLVHQCGTFYLGLETPQLKILAAVGNFIAAWVIYGTSGIKNNWSWRIPYLIHIPFATFMLFAVIILPESPRWLLSKGRHEEARAFLLRYHANGATADPLVDFELQEIQSQIDFEQTHNADSWSALFGTPGNRHRLACACLIAVCQKLSGTAIIAYYYTSILKLVGITNTSQVTGINAGLTTWTFIVAIFGLWLTQHINRRPQLALSWTTTLLANIGLVVSSWHYSGIAAVFFVWIYNAGFYIACGSLFYSYQVEILTYSTRAKGMMIWTITSKCCSIFNAYANSVALAKIGWHYYLVYTGTLVITGTLLYFLIVETRGYTLEEIAVLFDGDATAFSSMAAHDDEKKVGEVFGAKELDREYP